MTPRTFRDPVEWQAATFPKHVRRVTPAWAVTIKALYGTPLTSAELALYHHLSGGIDPTPGGASELLVVAGRRAGKSETIALVAAFEAINGGHQAALAAGQTALIPILSPLREQSNEIYGYATGICRYPSVRKYLAGEPTRDTITFTTGVAIKITTGDVLNVSGPTIVCAILDEFAKFPGAGGDPGSSDVEILNALRPAMAPIVGAPRRRLIGITSAYIKEGKAFEMDRDNFAVVGAPIMVVRGETAVFNPNIDKDFLAKECKSNPRNYVREYLAQWADALFLGYFEEKSTLACIRKSEPPKGDHDFLIAIDASGGRSARGDIFAVCVAHREHTDGRAPKTIIDLVVGHRPPFSPEAIVKTIADLAHAHGVGRVFGDQHAAGNLQDAFARHGIGFVDASWTAQNKAPRFAEARRLISDGHVSLPSNDPELIQQFAAIGVRTIRGGNGGEQIEASRGKDDMVSAVVLAIAMATEVSPSTDATPGAGQIFTVKSTRTFDYARAASGPVGKMHDSSEEYEDATDDGPTVSPGGGSANWGALFGR